MFTTIARCVIIISVLIATVSTAYSLIGNHFAEARATRLQQFQLQMMVGGLPALHARCIIETEHPEEIKDCIRIGTPNPGREL